MIIQDNDPFRQPSFSLKNRMMRLCWNIVNLILFRPTPRFMHGWRRTILRIFGAKIGKRVRVGNTTRIWAPWNVKFEDYSWIGEDANLYCMDEIRVGKYAVVSQGAHLCAGSHDYNSPNFQLISAPIEIAAYAWVCADAFVSMDVSIAEGVVVSARSVVTKSIEESWTVWGGMPAKKIGVRDRAAVLREPGASIPEQQKLTA